MADITKELEKIALFTVGTKCTALSDTWTNA